MSQSWPPRSAPRSFFERTILASLNRSTLPTLREGPRRAVVYSGGQHQQQQVGQRLQTSDQARSAEPEEDDDETEDDDEWWVSPTCREIAALLQKVRDVLDELDLERGRQATEHNTLAPIVQPIVLRHADGTEERANMTTLPSLDRIDIGDIARLLQANAELPGYQNDHPRPPMQRKHNWYPGPSRNA